MAINIVSEQQNGIFYASTWLVTVLSLLTPVHPLQAGCSTHPNWSASGFSSCMFISTNQGPHVITWQESRDICVSTNPWSTLAVLPTDEHDAVIASEAKNSTAYWVGIRVPSNDSRPYTWMDGTVETRNSLFPGSLSGLIAPGTKPSHLCGHVTLTIQPAHRKLSWSFGDCQAKRPYICIVDKSHMAFTTTKISTMTSTTPKITTQQINSMASGNQVGALRKTSRNKYSVQTQQTIRATYKCPFNTNVVDCLLIMFSSPQTHHADSMRLFESSFLLMDDIIKTLVSSTSNNAASIAQDFLLLLDAVLKQTHNKGTLPRTIHMIQEKIDVFANTFVKKAAQVALNLSIIRFTREHLEFLVIKETVAGIRGKGIGFKKAHMTINDLSHANGSQVILDTDEITVVAIVSHIPGSRSWLVDSRYLQDRKSQEVRVTSPIITLSASVRGQLVSLSHTFLLSYQLDEMTDKKQTDELFCSYRLRDKSSSYWDVRGCSTLFVNASGNECQNNSSDLNGKARVGIPPRTYLAMNQSCPGYNRSGTAECRCNHTTSFAIVMSIVDIPLDAANALALDIITYVGCGVTIVSMCIAITVFTCIRSLDSERVCVHRNLCVAILLAQLIFLMGVQAVDNKTVCRLVALLLHYFYMATFVWMLVEGLHLYSQVVRVFGNERSRITYYMCFGWGFPFLEVAVSAAIDWEGYGTKRSCWLSIERATIWAFVGPALSILFVNLLILTVVMRIIVLAAKVEKMDEIDHIRAGVKASLFLSPLLGVTWLFGLAAVNKDLLVFQYIFSILNSLQGFFIFLYHCVLNTDVRQTLKRMRDKRMLEKEIRTSSGSSQRASCSDNGTDLTPKQSTTPVFKRIRQVSPDIGDKDEIPTCHQANTLQNSSKSGRLMLMHI